MARQDKAQKYLVFKCITVWLNRQPGRTSRVRDVATFLVDELYGPAGVPQHDARDKARRDISNIRNKPFLNPHTGQPVNVSALLDRQRGVLTLNEHYSAQLTRAMGQNPDYLADAVRDFTTRYHGEIKQEIITLITEGSRYSSVRTIIRRNPRVRELTLQLKGNVCSICGRCPEDFCPTYNDSIMQAHHDVPISQYEQRGIEQTDVLENMFIVCGPCHTVHIPEQERDGLSTLELGIQSYRYALTTFSQK